jgi:hypothetical protein
VQQGQEAPTAAASAIIVMLETSMQQQHSNIILYQDPRGHSPNTGANPQYPYQDALPITQ